MQKFVNVVGGFSLFELLVTIAIAAILIVVGAPSFYYLLSKNSSIAEINKIVSALHYARNEAITIGGDVKFCKSDNAATCEGDWSDGQIVVDKQGNVLRVFSRLATNSRLIWHGGFGRNNYLEFNSFGELKTGAGSFLLYSSSKNVKTNRIIISQTGRIRQQTLATL